MNNLNSSVRKNLLYNGAYQLFAILVPLITTPFLTRTIGSYGIGEYGFAYSIAYYFTLFVKLGLNNYGSREIALSRENKKDTSSKFWEIYLFQVFLCIAFVLLYLVYVFYISSNRRISLVFAMMVLSSGIDVMWFFWGLEEFRLTVRRDFIIKVLTTICIFCFIRQPEDTWKYCALISASLLVSQAILIISIKSRVEWVRPSINSVIKHIKPNLVLFIPIIAISLYKSMDKIMLGMMSTEVEVGFYQSSENLIQVPVTLIASIGTVMQPRMSIMVSNKVNQEDIDGLFNKSIGIAMFLSTSLGFGLMTVAREFVPMFFGKGFEKCILLFYVLLPSCLFIAFANVIRTQYLIPYKKDREYVISLLCGAFINLAFNSALIPRLQSVGAAIGTLLAESSVCIVQSILMRKDKGVKQYVRIALPFVVSGVAMFLIWNWVVIDLGNKVINLGVKIFAAGGTYLLILYVLNRLFRKCFARR